MRFSSEFSLLLSKAVAITFLFFLSIALQVSPLHAGEKNSIAVADLKKIGIEEFQIQNISTGSTSHPIAPNTGVRVADIFYKELSTYHRYELTAPAEMPVSIELVKTQRKTSAPPVTPDRSSISKTGISNEMTSGSKELNESDLIDLDSMVNDVANRYKDTTFDAVVTGIITRYDDKNGSSMAVSKPASVAFLAYLVSIKDKRILWSGHYAETQEALLDNLLLLDKFSQAGGKWLSNDNLTELVMQRVVKTFPGINQSN